MNGETIRESSPTQPGGHVGNASDHDASVSEDADARSDTARNDESLRLLAHELRNCITPILNAVHMIRLRGNQDPELSTLIGLIERQVGAMVRMLHIAVDADRAAARGPQVIAPAKAVDASLPSARSVAAMPPQARRRILVADDNAAVRNSLAAILQELGHDVRQAADGIGALELAEQWLPEFVILDVHMPTISGYDVARKLRARFAPAVMQLVMMSGTDLDDTTLAGAKRAGFDHCIDKTFALKGLAALLRGDVPSPV
jgi:CheY-like chemotaxis protein